MLDNRPLPRLPLDTAETEAVASDGLDIFIVSEPGEPVFQIPMIETKTPTYNAPVSYCEVYHKPISGVWTTRDEAIAEGEIVTGHFKFDNPVPPQFPGEPS